VFLSKLRIENFRIFGEKTRPTHLLCLAIREDAFTTEEISLLKNRSWRVARVRDDDCEWL
jgi:hypothetical protein